VPVGLIGYCDPWTAGPGGSLSFMISSAGGRPFRSRVVRVRSADPNPAGPGMKLLPVPAFPEHVHPGREQHSHPGSSGWAACPPLGDGPFHIIVNARCLKHFDEPECLLALQNEAGDKSLALCLQQGTLQLRSGGDVIATTGINLAPQTWWSIGVVIDLRRSLATFDVVELRPRSKPIRRARYDFHIEGAAAAVPSDWSHVSLAAITRGFATLCFNGQLEAPTLGMGSLPDLQLVGGALGVDRRQALAAWDFSEGIETQIFHDSGPAGLQGTFRNLPTRATKGSNWSGREMNWRHCASEYGAVHFHADDVGDVGWERSIVLPVPEGVKSGVYALLIENDTGSDLIPFYVLPQRQCANGPRIVFLAPTMTYLAYANHARGNWSDTLRQRAKVWGAYPHNPDETPDFGFSTYNRHPDGTGIALSSRRRPIMTMRPGYLTFESPIGSGLKHFPDDTHLLDWLEQKGFDFDVVTDEDLDQHGVELIRDYTVLITGSHPEYHTENMLNALEVYRAGGGNFCYMGGNGFYWRIAKSSDLPYVLEVRRGESGIRAWAAEPGEYYHQFDGSYGGLWRRNGRPPQALVEIGFAVQGLFEGSPYRRTSESFGPDMRWIFDGVDGETFGEFGLSGGGAGGFELDQVSEQLGTSRNAVVLARSEGHGPSFKGVPEDVLTHTLSVGGGTEAIEAHMVYGVNDAGGQVFSTGSITFIGSLPYNNYDNPVSRIVENVVRRFMTGPKP